MNPQDDENLPDESINEDGSADMRHVLAAARAIGEHMTDYKLVVEAAREAGGREVVKVPLQWPPKSAQAPAQAPALPRSCRPRPHLSAATAASAAPRCSPGCAAAQG